MLPAGQRPLFIRNRLRWLSGCLCSTATWSLLGLGCANPSVHRGEYSQGGIPVVPPMVGQHRLPAVYEASEMPGEATGEIQTVGASEAALTMLPEGVVEPVAPKLVPIDLEAVLRLAEENNAQIGLARERLHESELENELACRSWLPNIYAGIAYYRHEGGIQDFNGRLIHSSTGALFPGLDIRSEIDFKEATFQRLSAERKLWQQRGDLSKVTNENLLEATSAYVDLLTARRGEAVAIELEKYIADVLKRAENLAQTDRGAAVMVEGIRVELNGRRQARARLRQQGDAASLKLAYLLHLDPHAQLFPVDKTFVPIELVDPAEPTEKLVSLALTNGPGVQELQGMLAVVMEGINYFHSPTRYLPTIQLNMAEGAFGAGPGGSLAWDNRWDLGLQARWNLTEALTIRERKNIAYSKLRQVELAQQDLHAKLTLGVKESREAILSGREQLGQGETMIKHAAEYYRLSKARLDENLTNNSTKEVMDAIHGLEISHIQYITALNSHNKAQLRLLLLLGPTSPRPAKASAPSHEP